MKQKIFFSLLLSLLLIANICSNAQTQLVEISKIYIKKDIPITDGLVYKYFYPNDTARYFQPGAKQYEATIIFKEIGAPPTTVTENIDDRDPSIVYTGTWTNNAGGPESFGSTIKFSNITGNSFSYTFTGKAITWIGEKFPHLGKAEIRIDNVVQNNGTDTTWDLYETPGGRAKTICKLTFPSGQHTIKITVTGQKNTASGGTFVVHDLFIVEK